MTCRDHLDQHIHKSPSFTFEVMGHKWSFVELLSFSSSFCSSYPSRPLFACIAISQLYACLVVVLATPPWRASLPLLPPYHHP